MNKETKLIQSTCSECGSDKVRAKSLCGACYSRSYRKTPKGMEKLKSYNDTKGKEARIRFLAKKPPKPPKPPKKTCGCGVLSVAKGLCFNCYQRDYQRKKNGYKKVRSHKNKSFKKDFNFKSVCSNIKDGLSISDAIKAEGLNSRSFYGSITEIQKIELRALKSIYCNKYPTR